MKKLIISATEKEIQPLLEKSNKITNCLFSTANNIEILITGIGAVQTVFKVMQQLETSRYDQLINVGIAGSFSPLITVGTVVEICSDTFGDFGIDDKGQFIPAQKIGFLKQTSFPLENGWLKNAQTFDKFLPQTNGITVQITSGSTRLIKNRIEMFNPDIETMESAAFFFVALQKKISFAAIRAISNFIEPRNKQNWNTELAIKNLNYYLEQNILQF